MYNGAYSGASAFRNNCGRCFSAALVSGKTKKRRYRRKNKFLGLSTD